VKALITIVKNTHTTPSNPAQLLSLIRQISTTSPRDGRGGEEDDGGGFSGNGGGVEVGGCGGDGVGSGEWSELVEELLQVLISRAQLEEALALRTGTLSTPIRLSQRATAPLQHTVYSHYTPLPYRGGQHTQH
jgi:hypothetical protein